MEACMSLRALAIASVAGSILAAPVLAHHSFAMFDATKDLTLDGTVKNFEWTNPHMWLYVMVPQANGAPVEYPLEMMAVQGAVRLGWKPDSVKPGDKVTFEFHPLRDGHPGGQLISVVLPGGKKLVVIANAGGGRQD
jgi:Family of unknown function (DUF6152)